MRHGPVRGCGYRKQLATGSPAPFTGRRQPQSPTCGAVTARATGMAGGYAGHGGLVVSSAGHTVWTSIISAGGRQSATWPRQPAPRGGGV